MLTDLGSVLDLTWKLLLVLGLAVIAARALRWMSSPAAAPAGTLTILARLGVGSQQSLVLLRAGEKRLVLGVTPQQITFLAELNAEDLAEPGPVEATSPWSNTLVQRLSGRTRPATPTGPMFFEPTFARLLDRAWGGKRGVTDSTRQPGSSGETNPDLAPDVHSAHERED